MSVATSSISWRSTRVLPPALVVVEVRWRARPRVRAARGDRRPPQAGACSRGGVRPPRSRVAARRVPVPRLPLRFDLVVVEPEGRAPARIRHAIVTPSEAGRRPRTRPVLHSRPVRGRPEPTRTTRPRHTAWSTHADRSDRDGAGRAHSPPAPGDEVRGGMNRQEVATVPSVSMRQLLEAGVHFGHQTRRWNPKMKPFIFAERNGIHIIDLAQTVQRLDVALEFVRETVARGDQVLFVGHQEAGPGAGRPGGGPRQPAVRQQALARRHAHQLRDHQEAHRACSSSSRHASRTATSSA